MQRTNISTPYGIPSTRTPLPGQLGPPNTLTSINNSHVNSNLNLMNPNYMIPGNNFISNSNCFQRPMANIGNTGDHPNNLKFVSKKRNKKQTVIKRKFTDSEDIALASLVEIHGQNNWKLIARNMPSERTPRQCRERWKYYLSEGIPNNDDWTHEEEKLLLEKYEIYGPHWAKIAKFFDHKNDINLKNRFNKIKRNKLSGMLFDPAMSEDFDNATRDKTPKALYSNQENSLMPTNSSNLTANPQPQKYTDTITDYSNDDDDGDENDNEGNVKNQIPSSNVNQNYFNTLYYPNQLNTINSDLSQPPFTLSTDSSSTQSSASSGKNSSNASMLNSAHAESRFPIIINTFTKNASKDKNDSSESSGNNSASSGSSNAPDYNTETSSNAITVGIDNRNYKTKNQFSVQSLLLNDKVFDEKTNNSNFSIKDINHIQQQGDSSTSNDGNRKIIEFPTPISLL